MLEVYPGRDEVMGVHVGRVVHEFGERTEHADGGHRDNLFQKVLQSQRGQCVGSDDCYFGSCHKDTGFARKSTDYFCIILIMRGNEFHPNAELCHSLIC